VNRSDDTSSDVAVADQSATDSRWSGREGDRIYRRPPAQPVPDEPGGSWFSGGVEVSASNPAGRPDIGEQPDAAPREWATGEQRAVEAPAAPDLGPATPNGSGRVSFGFSAGPISPHRQVAAPLPPTQQPPAPAVQTAQPAPPAQQQPVPRSPAQPSRTAHQQQPARPAPAAAPARPAPAVPPAATAHPDAGSGRRPALGQGPISADEFAALRPGNRTITGELAAIRPDEFAALRPGGGSGTGEFAAARADAVARADAAARADGPAGRPERSAGENTADRRGMPAEPARQSRFVTVGIVLLSVVVLLAGTIVGVVYFSGSDDKLDSVLQLGAGETKQRTVTAPLENRTRASFEMLAGANRVKLSIGELGDDLYRISTPDDAGIRPSPETRDDDVKLQVTKDGDGVGGEIEVVLAAKVQWQLRFSGYAEEQDLDLSGGQISGIEMVAGARRAEVSLSQPTGTIPVKVNGAVDELVLKSPAGSPVRVRVGGGSQTVVAGSRTLKDVPAGSTLTPKNWATQNRYDVTAGARITSLTVENA
jgi:hypothetical protein